MLSRFAQDLASRPPLPFLGVIAAAYGQDIGAVSWLSIALTLAGLISPLTSLLSHRFSSRQMLFWPPLVFVIATSDVLTASEVNDPAPVLCELQTHSTKSELDS